MDPNLLRLLERDNPWLLNPGATGPWLASHLPELLVPRSLYSQAKARWPESNKAHLLVGPRQVGKSTLIRAYLAQRKQPALVLDCGERLVAEWCRSAPLFLADLDGLVKAPVPLVFDEVQHLAEAGLFLKGLVDRRPGVPLLVTGSSSYHLRSGTRESLAGRASRLCLLPLSLAEVSYDLADLPATLREEHLRERLLRHIVVGGYPAAWLSERPAEVLAELIEAFVLRDASDIYRIAQPAAFRRLMRLMAGQVGSLVNISEWASLLGLSRDTVGSYLDILTDSHVVMTPAPFAEGKRAELTSRPKVYFVDPGVRNQLIDDNRPFDGRADRGPLLEQWVASELWKACDANTSLHFWRTTAGTEVDFVLRRGSAIIAIEVKAQAGRNPRLPRAARSFVEAYGPRALVVANFGIETRSLLGDTPIWWVRPERLADAVAEALTP